jgi:tRNA 2-selenouridine synthase
MTSQIKDIKTLFDYVRKFDLINIPDINTVLKNYKSNFISIEELLNLISTTKDILILDARSEKEFEETKIPNAINFPVLKNEERHNVGIVYKNYSPLAAFKLASEYADPKLKELKDFLVKQKAKSKNIIVYCWRGGGRSKYLAKMIFDCGYNPIILKGGIKSFRKAVIDFLSKDFKYKLIELTGLTGTGKTELLRAVSDEIPIIDLEFSARHFSSLFGFVPYKIRGFKPVPNQSAFENDIFSQIITQSKKLKKYPFFLIESESKKVGDFYIPQYVYFKMLEANTVNIITNIGVRINRIINDYFGSENIGLKDMEEIFIKKEAFFRRELSNKTYEYLLNCLKIKDTYSFTKVMINEYYDNKYKDKGKSPLATICLDDISHAKKELLKVLKNINK